MSLRKKEILRFIVLHGSRFCFCALTGACLLYACRFWADDAVSLKRGLLGAALSAMAYPSFRNLWKSFSSRQDVQALLALLLASYVCVCLADAHALTGGRPLSCCLITLSWQFFFMSWGSLEFLIQSQINSQKEKEAQNNTEDSQGMHHNAPFLNQLS
jgi:hypothetical protein